jgi:3-isopropylmalate dehydrogenase
MLLRHSLGLEEEARAVERAVDAAVTAGKRTGDMGSDGERVSTREMGAAVCDRIARG